MTINQMWDAYMSQFPMEMDANTITNRKLDFFQGAQAAILLLFAQQQKIVDEISSAVQEIESQAKFGEFHEYT